MKRVHYIMTSPKKSQGCLFFQAVYVNCTLQSPEICFQSQSGAYRILFTLIAVQYFCRTALGRVKSFFFKAVGINTLLSAFLRYSVLLSHLFFIIFKTFLQ
ncbi:hypothetical protein GDO81_015765 [Engystomops pustulosus]|uniref:Uncharacterized protein n=1 Tax=Engystomops pustulosus TaxID=76066 RepID=A0AAV7ATT3_ENGPU|nr:hypothetical protein GDO81_015765 [Engystomops pustulosus]